MPLPLTCAMSSLDQLWDDTVAGPPPENGLGKLRKSTSSNLRSASGKAETEHVNGEDGVRVTRSIMIMKPSGQTGSAPVSPAGSTPPVSPFAGIAIGSGWQAVAAIWHMDLKVILLMCLSLIRTVSAQTQYDIHGTTSPKEDESYPLKQVGIIFFVFVVVVAPIICCLKRTCGHRNFCGTPDQSGVELTVPEHPMCFICQKNLLNEQVIRTLPECNHSYHEECWWECIQQWAEPTCPLCRRTYLPDAEV